MFRETCSRRFRKRLPVSCADESTKSLKLRAKLPQPQNRDVPEGVYSADERQNYESDRNQDFREEQFPYVVKLEKEHCCNNTKAYLDHSLDAG